jgi:hypothetical protein
MLTTHPLLVPRLKKEEELYLLSPQAPSMACSGTTLLFMQVDLRSKEPGQVSKSRFRNLEFLQEL